MKRMLVALWAMGCFSQGAWAAAPSSCATPTFMVESSDALGWDVVAGRPHAFKATMYVSSGGSCVVDTTYSGNKPLDAWYAPNASYQPSGAAAPAMSASSSCSGTLALPSAAPAASPTSNYITLNFSSGVASFYLCPSDVGRYSLGLQDDSTQSVASGTSQEFVSRPFGLFLSNIKQSATVKNVKGTAYAGGPFAAAGTPFSATLTAKAWAPGQDTAVAGTADADIDVSGNATLTKFASSFTLAVISGSVTPAGGAVGLLGGASGSAYIASNFANGVYTGPMPLRYYEAGSMRMGVVSTSYLGMATIPSAPSEVIGRFFPSEYKVTVSPAASAPLVRSQCGSSMAYMDQPFLVDMTLTAIAGGVFPVTNYDQALGYNSSFMIQPTFGAYDGAGGTDLRARLSTTASAPQWIQGVKKYQSFPMTFSKTAGAQDGPFDQLQLVLVGTNTSATSTEGLIFYTASNATATGNCASSCVAKKVGSPISIRNGRLKIANAYGALLPTLNVPVSAEYWDGKSWTTNTLDSCSSIPSNAVSVGAYSGSLSSASSGSSALNLANGKAALALTRSGSGTGSAVVGINLDNVAGSPGSCASGLPSAAGASLPWLKSAQCGSSLANPNGKVIWGAPNTRGASVVFSRESY